MNELKDRESYNERYCENRRANNLKYDFKFNHEEIEDDLSGVDKMNNEQ